LGLCPKPYKPFEKGLIQNFIIEMFFAASVHIDIATRSRQFRGKARNFVGVKSKDLFSCQSEWNFGFTPNAVSGVKTLGLCPKPHQPFEKGWIQNFIIEMFLLLLFI
jgi:hypothetical protein